MYEVNIQQTIPQPTISLIGTGPQPQLIGYTHTNAAYQNVLVSGKYAYVMSSSGSSGGTIGLSLVIYDVSNPASPFYVGYLTTSTVPWVSGASYLNGTYSAALKGNYLYVASSGSSYLYIVDVSNPAAPTNVGRLLISSSPGSIYGVAVQNNYAYLATQNKGLTVVDVTNPFSPVQVFQEGGTLNKSVGVYVIGNSCYTTNYQTTSPWTVRYLKTWNITTPTTPSLINTYTLPAGTKPGEVTVQGNYAYVADLNTSKVHIVDITIPTAPNYLSSLTASASFNVANNATFNSLTLSGNYAYLTSGSNSTYGGAIDLFDITNKSSPVKISTTTENVASSVFGASVVYNNLLYVADYGVAASYSASLKIYSTPTVFSNYIPTKDLAYISAQASSSVSGVSGQLVLQGSDDVTNPSNWTDVSGTTTTISSPGAFLIPKTDISYQYVRLAFTGAGGFNINFKALGF
jgi:hypothetical protein